MFSPIIILIRILFIACMVFIIGYVFGPFAKNATLAKITKVASILAVVLFVSANIFFMRMYWRDCKGWEGNRFHKSRTLNHSALPDSVISENNANR